MTQPSYHRLAVVKLGFIAAAFVIIARLFYWQVWKHTELSLLAEQQYESSHSISSPRGTIFDRKGAVLSTNEEKYTLFAEPKLISDPTALITAALPIVEPSWEKTPLQATDEAWIQAKRTETQMNWLADLTGEKRWVALSHKLNREQKSALTALNLPGIGFDTHQYRLYPDASVSAHLLGFVGKNSVGEDQGYFGLEGYYDLELRGRAGRVEGEKNALGLPIALGENQQFDQQPGRDLYLTIDTSLQFQVEELLKKGLEKYGASAGEVVIMDPNNGEILAMAAFPNFDPAHFLEFDPKTYRNPSISELYEPGSTLKVLTVAAGLEEKAITPDTTCTRCSGPRTISGFPIRTWNEEYNPNISMRDALAKSDNTAMVFIQEELGKEKFLHWLRLFGLDGKTNIDLQGEEDTNFRQDKDWRQVDVATASFGQGIAVTSLNLVRAVGAVANGGMLLQPHVVRSVRDQGKEYPVLPKQQSVPLSPETIQQVKDMMVYTVQQGDAKWAAPKDIAIAGKTGTAQISEKGKYLEDKTIASFIGFAPADKPKFVMLVKLREPTSSPWGSETAAPLWFQIARLLL